MNRVLGIALLILIAIPTKASAARGVKVSWAPDDLEFEIIQQVVAHRQMQRESQRPYLDDAAKEETAKEPGFADFHVHQLSEYGFGGRVVYGGQAPCDGEWHGLGGSLLKILLAMPHMLEDEVLSDLLPHCRTFDLPTHDGWTHEQYGVADLRRAHENGLNLIVNYAVNATIMCAISERLGRSLDKSCDDAENVDRQLRAMWRFEDVHDSWYAIALDPIDVHYAWQGEHPKLAVIPGIEASDYLASAYRGGIFGADQIEDRYKNEPDCSPSKDKTSTYSESVEFGPWRRQECAIAHAAVRHMDIRGVRSVVPSHEWNSEVAGAAINLPDLFQPAYGIAIHQGQADRLGMLPVGYAFAQFAGKRTAVDRWPTLVEIARDPALNIEFPRNQQGLTPLGRALLRAMRDENMIVDLAHFSERAALESLALFELWNDEDPQGGPMVLSSHITPRSTSMAGAFVLEYPIGDGVLAAMGHYGFMTGRMAIGLRTGAAAVRSVQPMDASYDLSSRNCIRQPNGISCAQLDGRRISAPGDVSSAVQMYEQIRHLGLPVGFGSDMNGAAVQVAPRRCLKQRFGHAAELVPCTDVLTGAEIKAGMQSAYARRGLATTGELPWLAADIQCEYDRAGGVDSPVSCNMAARADAMDWQDLCNADGKIDALCESAQEFARGWLDMKPKDPTRPRIPSTVTPYVDWEAGMSGAAPVTRSSTKDGTLQLFTNTEHAQDALVGSGLNNLVDLSPAGEFVVIDRQAARLVTRELRRGGLIGSSCTSISEILSKAEHKKEKKEGK